MFLKVQGVTGEAVDTEHKGEIEVISWSWGMQAPTEISTGLATGATRVSELPEISSRMPVRIGSVSSLPAATTTWVTA